ncbi:MAG: endonuclease/exonuclease/phosphatase family protein [Gemmatimonadaceae bacterium]|nr:endonuclease/exonuclease/phosphatase family protein [Gemmatimonadaceae bacterium]
MELKTATIEDEAIRNTACVLADVDADVVTLVEVESRQTLRRFHDDVLLPLLRTTGRLGYDYDLVIEGNDPRGIDVGLLSRYPIDRVRSHVADRSGDSPTFSRDCPEYYVTLPGGQELAVLPNHLASKGSDRTGERRRVQSAAIAKIYKRIRKTHDLVLVAGDLNDHPEGGSLDKLLNTDLKDAMSLPLYDGLPGTYGHGRDTEKLDYLLCSPKLRRAITQVDVNRKGFYAPKKWESYESINAVTKGRYQASDHHCVWAEVAV